MHTLNSAASIIAIAFNRMLAEGEEKHTASSWITNYDERTADFWLIEGIKKKTLTYDELYEAFVKAGVESDNAERLIENLFWHAD